MSDRNVGVNKQFPTREAWLNALLCELRPMFSNVQEVLPEKIRITCGWPSRGGLAKRKRVIGQCWDIEVSGDKSNEIFISPMLELPGEVAETVVHELIHTIYMKDGHKGPFKRAARKLGLEGKMTSTNAGVELQAKLSEITQRLGPYVHAMMTPTVKTKTQGTRLVLLEQIKCDQGCVGYKLRTTRVWIDKVGVPMCAHGKLFEEQDSSGGDE